MTITNPPTLRISTCEDLITAVPYLLGFHPEESLVLVGVNDTTVIVTARIDLDDFLNPSLLFDVLRAIRRGFATGVIAVAYTEILLRADLSDVPLADPAEDAGLELLAALFVTGGRWCRLNGGGTGNDLDGKPVPDAATVVHAAATYAGMTALPNRQALTDLFTPTPAREGLRAALERHQDIELSAPRSGAIASHERGVVDAMFEAHRAAQGGAMPTDDDVTRYGVALRSNRARDEAWKAIDDGQLEGIELWVNLARRLPSPFDAAPLLLAAWRSYRDGNGAVAGIAAELALASDPDYGAADLLLAALAHGVDPRTLRRLHPKREEGAATD